MNTQKPHLSYSSIKSFLDCNKKYEYQYLNKMSVPEDQQMKKYLSFGKSVHKALAQFNKITDQSEISLDTLHDLLRTNWIREGYSSIEEEKEFGIRGLDMLTQYYKDPKDKGKETVLVEEMVSLDLEEYYLHGIIDKAYITYDNKLEVVDYKTGKSLYPLDNIQLPIYLFLSREKLGIYPNLVSYYFLSHNKKYTREVTKDLIDDLSIDVHNLCKIIVQNKSFNQSRTSYCRTNCQYYQVCNILNFKCGDLFSIHRALKH